MATAGCEIVEDPIERTDGQHALYVNDPNGNRLEFATTSGSKRSNRIVDEMGYKCEGDE